MKSNYRLATIAAIFAISGLKISMAQTQSSTIWPEKQITIVSVSAAGGNSDVVARAVGQKLSERLKIPVVIENKPGASGAIASAYVAKSPADGYTVLAGSIASHAIYPQMISKPLFDPARDYIPVTVLGTNSNVLVVPNNSPYKTLQDILAAGRTTPGSVAYGSPGVGSTQHMSGELLQKMSGVKLTHIPNPRGSVVTDVMAGHIPMTFDGPSLVPHVLGGRLRPIAVTSKKRWPQLPDVPTMEEAGIKGFEVTSWQAIYVPTGTPKANVEKLQREVAAVLATTDLQARFHQLGLTPSGITSAEFSTFQNSEIAKWGTLIREAGIKVE